MKSIAIMQPTFLPWIGYFALIDRVDEFVFLDTVQFDKRSWQQRNKIKTSNGSMWLSVPVLTKGRSGQAIQDVEILYENDKNPLLKVLKSIEQNYTKAPFFKEYFSSLKATLETDSKSLSDLNIEIITWICREMDIRTPLIKASALEPSGAKDELLVDICKRCDATQYISPPGAKAYLADSVLFDEAGIELVYHNYDHPTYNQLHDDFTPYMGCVDLLFNEGPNSLKIIKSGLSAI